MTEVLIVGAGPTGLTLGCGLLRHGVRVRLIDRATGPATTSRANILHARGVEVLDRLGALGDLAEHAVRAMTVTMHVGGRPMAVMRFGDPGIRTSHPALVVSQAEIEARLRDRFTGLGGTIEWHTELTGIHRHDDDVTATLRDGTEIHAGWLAGCDGAHSTVRGLTGVGFPGAPVAERFLLADVHADWDFDRSGTAGWYHRDGVLLAMPMRGATNDRWRLMADIPASAPEPSGEQDILDRFHELFPARAGLHDVHIREAAWTSVFRIHRRLAERYRDGRVLLAGDAAHIHSPMGGQGMNTGIGDAENLAWKLALVVHGHASEPLLDSYQAERRPLAADVLRSTTAATRLQVGGGPIGRFLRDRVMVPLVNRPAVQRKLTYGASQLWVHYRRGPLGGTRFGGEPRPGDRVPDRPCLRADGSRTRLHAELGGSWALLAPAGTPDERLRDALGGHLVTLTPATGTPKHALLIRPDGHLAWRGAPDSPGAGRWLDDALRHGRAKR